MKKKVLALTLTAALALSSTSAFAATTNCTKVTNYDINSLLKIFTSNSCVKQYKLTVNGKTVDLNTVDLNTVLNTNTTKTVKTQPVAKTAVTQPVAVKPAATQPVTTAPAATQPAATQPTTPTTNTTVSSSNLSYEQKVAELVNVERQKAGLSALTLDSTISNVARTKSKDMATNNYFAHQSPTYGSAGDMLTKFGIKWSAWGENIASGQRTPEAVVTAWMNSAGHKANILSPNFSKIGV
ncbi:MAG: CAP domain-containing protein [Sedimentibacter sp.]|uniref:CAP domain-containing protein n=1 Tax=Sedimentibacter sp. TaxID=1960295 RepID=UPI002981F1D3|nr:CAP domain-containing protein [Sedimentibacter sp.]MDW5299978.1 CAP domain-containing protein [Sedimentibacter sp.]